MRSLCCLIVVFTINGCALTSAVPVQEGNSEKRVLKLCGIPDVISEQSGDLGRWYTGGLTLDYKWPWSAIKKFYYLETETVITIQYDQVKSICTMSEEDKKMVRNILAEYKGNGFVN